MHRSRARLRTGLAALLAATWTADCRAAATEDDLAARLNAALEQGDLPQASADLRQILADDPHDAEARFGLGALEALGAIDDLATAQYRHGALTELVRTLPILRLPIPPNPKPEPLTYAQFRDILANFQSRLLAAEAELAQVDLSQPVKLPLDLARIGFDVNDDGRIDANERFLSWFGAVNRLPAAGGDDGFRVAFDNGDVLWLRGYCHFLAAVCDAGLAYDAQRLFDVCGHLVYPAAQPSQPAAAPFDRQGRGFDMLIADVIAAIHLIDFPLTDPARMQAAHGHLLAMIRTSRESWQLILQETDNDDEWLPNPRQTGRLQMPVTQDLIDGWHGVLAEMEDLLEGRKLIPFWRDYLRIMGPGAAIPPTGRGVNLRRALQEPRDFDLILAVQGTAVLPYVEEGPLSQPQTWNELLRAFRGSFFGFAIWFN